MAKTAQPARMLAVNRRARREYEILDKLEAGLVLAGTEVKSARAGKVQLKDSYVEVRDGEAFLVGAHISHYTHGNRQNHEPERPRKLLLKRREIDRIFGKTTIQGLTCVPLAVYLKGRHIKVEIAVARGRKLHDKRLAEKKKVLDREAQEAISARG
ncbi:MAG: SsrA-binding protein SmpB [Acidobacteriota bacterium]|nr:SsrA-binding protein SmpB [Acidobacteriota bacterium]